MSVPPELSEWGEAPISTFLLALPARLGQLSFVLREPLPAPLPLSLHRGSHRHRREKRAELLLHGGGDGDATHGARIAAEVQAAARVEQRKVVPNVRAKRAGR